MIFAAVCTKQAAASLKKHNEGLQTNLSHCSCDFSFWCTGDFCPYVRQKCFVNCLMACCDTFYLHPKKIKKMQLQPFEWCNFSNISIEFFIPDHVKSVLFISPKTTNHISSVDFKICTELTPKTF